MLQLNHIFDFSSRGWRGKDGYVRVIVRNPKDTNLPLGAPVLISKDSYEMLSHSQDAGAASLEFFSLVDCYKGRRDTVRLRQLTTTALEPFTDRHEVVEFEGPVTVDVLLEKVMVAQKDHSVSLVLPMGEHADSMVTKHLKTLFRGFKVAGVLNANDASGNMIYDKYPKARLVINLFSLEHCIPIFDTKKVDGVIMQMILLDAETSESKEKPIHLFSTSFILSNHTENVCEVDSQTVRQISTAYNDILSKFYSGMQNWLSGYNNHIKMQAKKTQKDQVATAPLTAPIPSTPIPQQHQDIVINTTSDKITITGGDFMHYSDDRYVGRSSDLSRLEELVNYSNGARVVIPKQVDVQVNKAPDSWGSVEIMDHKVASAGLGVVENEKMYRLQEKMMQSTKKFKKVSR